MHKTCNLKTTLCKDQLPPPPPPPSSKDWREFQIPDWETLTKTLLDAGVSWGLMLATLWKFRTSSPRAPMKGSRLLIRFDAGPTMMVYAGGPNHPLPDWLADPSPPPAALTPPTGRSHPPEALGFSPLLTVDTVEPTSSSEERHTPKELGFSTTITTRSGEPRVATATIPGGHDPEQEAQGKSCICSEPICIQAQVRR
ncbi:hypothetical protein BDZ91DRAFT_781377 [Kalaharituber pfeilii]|nr:hypothetical protein BDZ91DRAFT_781377 [Kalaharituber pfeilii]